LRADDFPAPSRRLDGFTLVEALAALAIFAMAVLVAAAFLQAHAAAARRLELRSALVVATETAIEEVRAGVRPLASTVVDSGPGPGEGRAAPVIRTTIEVAATGSDDLHRVVVTSRSAAAGEPLEVAIATLVWRP
jgi:type II secretion system protein I